MLRRFWKSVLAVTLLGLAAGVALCLLITPSYKAETSLFLNLRRDSHADDLAEGSKYVVEQMGAFAQVTRSPLVLEPVIEDLGLETTAADLASRVSVTVPVSTSIVHIAVLDTEAERASATSDAIAGTLVDVIGAISPRDTTGRPVIEATITSPAPAPVVRAVPDVTQILILCSLLGLLLAVGQALVRHLVDRGIRDEYDIAHAARASRGDRTARTAG